MEFNNKKNLNKNKNNCEYKMSFLNKNKKDYLYEEKLQEKK